MSDFEIVPDTMRFRKSGSGLGRALSDRTRALLDGKTLFFAGRKSMPVNAKTINGRGYKLHASFRDGGAYVWAEKVETPE
jgi:hypothetical protein